MCICRLGQWGYGEGPVADAGAEQEGQGPDLAGSHCASSPDALPAYTSSPGCREAQQELWSF